MSRIYNYASGGYINILVYLKTIRHKITIIVCEMSRKIHVADEDLLTVETT